MLFRIVLCAHHYSTHLELKILWRQAPLLEGSYYGLLTVTRHYIRSGFVFYSGQFTIINSIYIEIVREKLGNILRHIIFYNLPTGNMVEVFFSDIIPSYGTKHREEILVILAVLFGEIADYRLGSLPGS